MKKYAVCIADKYSSGEMKVETKNKTEARQKAREYIRAWKLEYAKIDYIKEIA